MDKLAKSELEYYKAVLKQKQSMEMIFAHYVMFLKEKYSIPPTGGIGDDGTILRDSPKLDA